MPIPCVAAGAVAAVVGATQDCCHGQYDDDEGEHDYDHQRRPYRPEHREEQEETEDEEGPSSSPRRRRRRKDRPWWRRPPSTGKPKPHYHHHHHHQGIPTDEEYEQDDPHHHHPEATPRRSVRFQTGPAVAAVSATSQEQILVNAITPSTNANRPSSPRPASPMRANQMEPGVAVAITSTASLQSYSSVAPPPPSSSAGHPKSIRSIEGTDHHPPQRGGLATGAVQLRRRHSTESTLRRLASGEEEFEVKLSSQQHQQLSEDFPPPPVPSVASERLTDTPDLGHDSSQIPSETTSSNDASAALLRQGGFVDGNFASGRIHDVLLTQACYTMAYGPGHPDSSLLAVGLRQGLAFYETMTYAKVHVVPLPDMVSGLCWIRPPTRAWGFKFAQDPPPRSPLLAVGRLDGWVGLYRVDVDILEMQGPTLLHQFQLPGQVRALDAGYFGKWEASLVIAVGDKEGNVQFSSYTPQLDHIGTEVLFSSSWRPVEAAFSVSTSARSRSTGLGSAVLGLSLFLDQAIAAICTKAGDVVVYPMERDYLGIVRLVEARKVWCTQRSGPVRSVVFSAAASPQPLLAFGGYDKGVILVDTAMWQISRELRVQGTVNIVSFDPEGRYLGVGCRDKTFTLFDTSTYVGVKLFNTPGWVTAISWNSSKGDDHVAVRSDRNCISILDLNPTQTTEIFLSAQLGTEICLSWSINGRYLARSVGREVLVADALDDFRDVATSGQHLGGDVVAVSFCPVHSQGKQVLATIDETGNLSIFQLHDSHFCQLQLQRSEFIGPFLKALTWSPDGTMLVTGGRDSFLHVLSAMDLLPVVDPINLRARLWDMCFLSNKPFTEKPLLAISLGDYTSVFLNEAFEPTLQVIRPRTCRCLASHPNLPILAIGDGSGTVAIVDYSSEEIVHEFSAESRVNVLQFSPVGDFIVVGTDDHCFTIRETTTYQSLQYIKCRGFAMSASFSSGGTYLALGAASDSYTLLRLGPLLAIDLVPLDLQDGVESLPPWALNEVLYRSGNGHTFVQRHMIQGSAENLRRVANILRSHPNTIFTFNRSSMEGCFHTALVLKKPNLLKLAVTTIVDGTLENKGEGHRSILTTGIPQRGRETLADIADNFSADIAVDVLNSMTFFKVPFTTKRAVDNGSRLECGSSSYTDPWEGKSVPVRHLTRSEKFIWNEKRSDLLRIPAVLPLPGLGEMDFLLCLLNNCPPTVFDNKAMALVLRVLWRDHIRIFFFADCFIYILFYTSWITLVELTASPGVTIELSKTSPESWVTLATLIFNALFTIKEIIQSRFGQRDSYWRSIWNIVDLGALLCVFGYFVEMAGHRFERPGSVPLAVVTTLFLTVKLLSYLRGFGNTGWLISVLIANFQDVQGFLIILLTILVGFAVSFRLLLGDTDGAFDSLRRSFVSTFELTVTGSYDSNLFFDSKYSALAVLAFILAVTCVLVIALNALISILADSYARVQEHAVANRRREQAALICEYMMLLPPRKRRRIENETKWFHTLLEVDADGDLLVQKDDWEGGLNALRRDIMEIAKSTRENHQRDLETWKTDLDSDINKLKRDVMSALEELSEDVKTLKKRVSGGITLNGKNVANAVKAIQSVQRKGAAFFTQSEE